jgi:guanine deaminase
MMDRITYDETIDRSTILERSVRESAELIERWHGADGGRLGYAVTPRFAISCTAELLAASAALARELDCWWQTHVSEDRAEIDEVARLFPDARDYLDVYDRAGGLGPRSILAHAIHLSPREQARVAETGTRLAHCPTSNLFIGAGIMPLADRLASGISVGLGSDVSGGAELSLFGVMRTGAFAQQALRALDAGAGAGDSRSTPVLGPLDWLRLGTLDGARALGLGGSIGSLEAGKEADMIAIDPSFIAPLVGQPPDDDPAALASRLIFRAHPDMVRAAWVRGRRLEGPGRPG